MKLVEDIRLGVSTGADWDTVRINPASAIDDVGQNGGLTEIYINRSDEYGADAASNYYHLITADATAGEIFDHLGDGPWNKQSTGTDPTSPQLVDGKIIAGTSLMQIGPPDLVIPPIEPPNRRRPKRLRLVPQIVRVLPVCVRPACPSAPRRNRPSMNR